MSFREKITEGWVNKCQEYGIPVTDSFSLYDIMADPVEVRQWQLEGLPYDKLSVENGILVTQSSRWSLMIDPQGQARYWLGNKEKNNGLKTMKPSTPNMLRMVEAAIRNGNPLIFEDAGEVIDPALEPVLLKQVYKQQGRTLLRLGDSDIDYDPNFKFYITTKLPNPHYTPELCIKVTVVNFTVTFNGLEDQLLAEVVMLERPDLEETKNELIKSMAADKKQIAELEDKILTMLKEAEGNILDNQALVDTLEESKKTSNIIAEHLEEAERTNENINTARSSYKPVSIRGSILYFVVADLSKINDMYQYSLDFFKSLFRLQIEMSEKNADVELRCGTLIKNITECVYMNVCRGLFERDKIVLAFLFCCSILRNMGSITNEEWSFYVRGSAMCTEEGRPENPDETWLTPTVWGLLDALDRNVEAFKGICQDIDDNLFAWKAYIQDPEPQSEPVPGDWAENLTYFQKLILIKCIRPEKMLYIMMDFVKHAMGSQYIDPIPIDLSKIYPETSFKAATIFVFATGCDPTDMLFSFAKGFRENGEERMHIVSLGQGQGPRAEKFIELAVKNGDWVFLQNCHLAKTFMPRLELMIESWGEEGSDINPSFRLWLSTMPCAHFPITVLQNGIKITTEPPRGLRANMLRSYHSSVSEEFIASCNKEKEFKKLIMGCVFFHAIIQERKKFGPLGWNIKYEFNDSDLQVSLEMAKMYLNESSTGVPWETLTYMLSEISYGGRVTDGWDRRCIASILGVYYREDILNDDYKFSPSGMYYAPPNGALASYSDYISGLPYQEDPSVFGMHENANIAFQMQESGYTTDTIMGLQAQDSSGGGSGKSLDEIVGDFVADLLETLPPKLSPDEDEGTGQFDVDDEGLMDSMTTVLSHEMNRFNKLINVILRILNEMNKALQGLVVMSDELDAVYSAITTNVVPPAWAKAAYPSLKPLGSWVKDLFERIAFIRKWLVEGKPKAFWLSGFYFPQGFMTGMLQSHSRRYKIAIDTLNIKFTVQKLAHTEIEDVPEDGVMCYGMFMDGARFNWEETHLEDSAPGVIYSTLPPIHLAPTANFVRNKEDYETPLYKTSVRAGTLSTTGHSTNFVVALDLPSDKDPNYWVLKGAAALCSLNE
jgi:dynein heavy chain